MLRLAPHRTFEQHVFNNLKMPTEKKEPKHPRLNNKANRARHEKENQQIRILKIAGIAVDRKSTV